MIFSAQVYSGRSGTSLLLECLVLGWRLLAGIGYTMIAAAESTRMVQGWASREDRPSWYSPIK